ncbi:MAG: N-acetylmuramoyl-L-alanine amidase [Halanaerobiales bacterium]
MFIKIVLNPMKILISLFLLVFFSLLIMNYLNTPIPTQSTSMEFKVVIDAGHGSIDTGTSHGNVLEKEINLEIAKRLAKELKKYNIKAILTRTEDKLYMDSRSKDIIRRPQIANEANADLFISLHANNYSNSQPRGSQIFYKKNCEESSILAEIIKEELINIRDANNRSNQMGDFLVLNMLKCPGVLIEVGFLSNAEDRQKLKDSNYQNKISKAIRKGIIKYFQENLSNNQRSISSFSNSQSLEKSKEDNLLFYIQETEKEIYHIQKKLSFPSSNFFIEEYNLLSFQEIMALSALEELINPPKGLHSPFASGTYIKSLSIKENIAIIDLSSEARENFIGGASLELLAVDAIKNTLFSIEGINGIKFLIDGKEEESFAGHIIFDQIYYK